MSNHTTGWDTFAALIGRNSSFKKLVAASPRLSGRTVSSSRKWTTAKIAHSVDDDGDGSWESIDSDEEELDNREIQTKRLKQ
jgi:hypothetical protein